jgi:hypothetical protein
VSLEKLLDEIGDQLVLIARTEAVKQVKETEKFLSEMYEHKVKELEDKFDEMMEDKVKEFEERIERARAISQAEISFMGPGRSPLRNIQLGENPNEVSQICKRAELKEKILNSTTMRSCHNIDTCQSFLSDSFGSDPTLEKLTERMKQIEENFKHEVKTTTLKITGIKTQCRADLDTTEAAIKEQINSGF